MPWLRSRVERSTGLTTWAIEWREAGKVRHAGLFPALEDQLCGIMPAGRYEGPGKSPDRADALVWALTELLLGGARSRPRALVV